MTMYHALRARGVFFDLRVNVESIPAQVVLDAARHVVLRVDVLHLHFDRDFGCVRIAAGTKRLNAAIID